MPSKIAPFGSWTSPITPSLVAAGTLRFRELWVDGEDVYWVEMRPTEGGRCAIVRGAADGSVTDVLPAPWNARSRVHEYGGGSFLVDRSTLYFSHFADGRVYRVNGADVVPLTPAIDGAGLRFADFCADSSRARLLAVGEDHRAGKEPKNFLAAIATDRENAPTVLDEGHDFYACPRLSPDGQKLAWLTWDHPNMPWDGCELWVAEVTSAGGITNKKKVAGGPDEALFQPAWSPDGTLYFVSDRTGWWNLYRDNHGATELLCPREAEFGLPQWVFGMSTYAFGADGDILLTYWKNGMGTLARLTRDGKLDAIDTPFREFNFVKAAGDTAAFLGGAPNSSPSVVRYDFKTQKIAVVRKARERDVDGGYLSYPKPITFPTAGGQEAHAFYYEPKSADYRARDDERPPLIVISHGGPTGSTSPTLELSIQYWTSRGFAVVDVNYGGSTGYGREYRRRLEGQWGVVDVEDCVRAAQYLVAQGLADGKRLIIRGGSAGGYTTLCALTFHDVFRAGASYYGVGDIEALIRDTHKFESRYDQTLIGPHATSQALYRARSPIHATDRLNCPIILFQGLDDKVVPPNQSETFFQAAKSKGLPVAYVPFEGEGHGFRRAENIVRSLEAELYFYAKVIGFDLSEKITPVSIENLPE